MRLRFAALVLLLAIAAASGATLWRGRYPLGLDFEGGARLGFTAPPAASAPAARAELVAALRQRAVAASARAEVMTAGDALVVELPGFDRAAATGFARTLTAGGLGFYAPADLDGAARDELGRGLAALGATLDAADPSGDLTLAGDATRLAEVAPPAGTRWLVATGSTQPHAILVAATPVLDRRAVAAIAITDGRLELTLDAAGAASFAALTRGHLGRHVALALGDRLLMAPRVASEIAGGKLVIDPAGEDLRALADALAHGGLDLVLADLAVVASSLPAWRGRPLALAVAALAALLLVAAALVPRRRLPLALGVALTASVAGLAYLLHLGGTLSQAAELAGLWIGLPCGKVAWFAGRRPHEPSLLARLVAGWPGWLAFALVAAIAAGVAHFLTLHGQAWRGMVHGAGVMAIAAIPAVLAVALLGALAAAAPSPANRVKLEA